MDRRRLKKSASKSASGVGITTGGGDLEPFRGEGDATAALSMQAIIPTSVVKVRVPRFQTQLIIIIIRENSHRVFNICSSFSNQSEHLSVRLTPLLRHEQSQFFYFDYKSSRISK